VLKFKSWDKEKALRGFAAKLSGASNEALAVKAIISSKLNEWWI
jgi:hypothetical protein